MKKTKLILTIVILLIVSISAIVGFNKYKLKKDIVLAEKTAQLLGMNESNYLATKHSTCYPMYDSVEVLFSSPYSLEALATKIKELGFQKLDYFDTRPDHNYPPPPPVGSVASGLMIRKSRVKVIPNVTSWRVIEESGKIFKVDYIEISELEGEWIYRGREVGNKLIEITLDRLN